jgi:hypothetical protein
MASYSGGARIIGQGGSAPPSPKKNCLAIIGYQFSAETFSVAQVTEGEYDHANIQLRIG